MDRPSPAEVRRAAKALALGALLGTVMALLSRRRARPFESGTPAS